MTLTPVILWCNSRAPDKRKPLEENSSSALEMCISTDEDPKGSKAEVLYIKKVVCTVLCLLKRSDHPKDTRLCRRAQTP